MTHAHPECGNGVTWSLELRRGATRQRLAGGTAQGSKAAKVGPIENVAVQAGDLVSLLDRPARRQSLVRPDGDRSEAHRRGDEAAGRGVWPTMCRATCWPAIRTPTASATRVWHFYTEPDKDGESSPVIPAGSLLAKWQAAQRARTRNASWRSDVQKLLTSGPPGGRATARTRCSIGSLPRSADRCSSGCGRRDQAARADRSSERVRSSGASIRRCSASIPTARPSMPPALCVQAPSVDRGSPARRSGGRLRAGHDRRARRGDGRRRERATASGRRQAAERAAGLLPSDGDSDRRERAMDREQSADFVCHARSSSTTAAPRRSASRRRSTSSADCFPPALCYTKIVPVDEVVTLTLVLSRGRPSRAADARRGAAGSSSTGCGTSCTTSARTR